MKFSSDEFFSCLTLLNNQGFGSKMYSKQLQYYQKLNIDTEWENVLVSIFFIYKFAYFGIIQLSLSIDENEYWYFVWKMAKMHVVSFVTVYPYPQ